VKNPKLQNFATFLNFSDDLFPGRRGQGKSWKKGKFCKISKPVEISAMNGKKMAHFHP